MEHAFQTGQLLFPSVGAHPGWGAPSFYTKRGTFVYFLQLCFLLLLKTCKLGEISLGIISLCVDSPVVLVSLKTVANVWVLFHITDLQQAAEPLDGNPPHRPEEVYTVYNFPHSPFVEIKEVKQFPRGICVCAGAEVESGDAWRGTSTPTPRLTQTFLTQLTFASLFWGEIT